MSKINSYKKYILAGIGGIGVSALARLFKAQGAIVRGSDAAPSTITPDVEALGY
jgi:UDP-N-acetylmuramate--alanine ligase